MLLDNEKNNTHLKIHQWLSKYTQAGTLSIVTGYFTVGALAFLAKETQDKITAYRFILGDIVNFDFDKDRSLDLLNEEITIDASLKLSKVAREAVTFLELEAVEAKTLEPNFCHAKLYLYQNTENDPQKNYYISGSSNLTEAGMGMKATSNVELNIGSFGSDPQYHELVKWFDSLWVRPQAHVYKTIRERNGKTTQIPFKAYLIGEIKKIFVQYTPLQLYYKVLFELFGKELLSEKENPELNRQIGRLENTGIYHALYEFQQKGVLSLIKMLQKYNGAILADAVGLGKTWTALAVMKFYQLQGREVVVICPKKIQHNWRMYLKNQNARFEKDGFEYFLRYHTDLTEALMDNYTDRADKRFVNDKPKLFVIDESHNLRNDKAARYQFLVKEILQKNEDVKVLMLSATPVNNSLNDIRNQFRLIVKGNPKGFADTLDIRNIDATFRTAQKAFNTWSQQPDAKISIFIEALPAPFFKLTDALTVARTRKMIEGQQDGLEFPRKAKPENLFVTPSIIGNYESFEELFNKFPPMLSGYQPSFYTKAGEDISVLQDQKQRDRFLVKMLYILLVKRLESSWCSFATTVEKILNHHQNALDKIKTYQTTKKDTGWEPEQLDVFDDDEITAQMEGFSLGKKSPVRLTDIDKADKLGAFKTDLKTDIAALEALQTNLEKLAKKIDKETQKPQNYLSADDKLQLLIAKIKDKRKAGANNQNQKVLIFTVYKDTAFYLYEQLKARGFTNLAAVSGDASRVWNETTETKNFEPILQRFAPYTKLFREKEWAFQPTAPDLPLSEQFETWKTYIATHHPATHQQLQNPIDILIATDTLSEGQNLQDCDLVINYDVHWNPVRLIQRMGRIDRLGSPNTTISGINFWPAQNINNYLNLQGRIEQRMALMRLGGAEVQLEFSETFQVMAADEKLEQSQKNRMMEQMQASWEEIDTEKTVGFDDFSLETFRQDLMVELSRDEKVFRDMPQGIYTGFRALAGATPGLIALLGYPAKPPKAAYLPYKGYELIYIDDQGKPLMQNQREVLEVLAKHKNQTHHVPPPIDQGETEAITRLSAALQAWLKSQTVQETEEPDGTVTETMGGGGLDLLRKLQTDPKAAITQLKTEGNPADKYRKDNFDLITWFIVSEDDN